MSLRKTTLTAAPADQGADLLTFLAARLNLSRRQAKDLLDRRQVFVNNRRVWMAHHTLRVRDAVIVMRPDAPPAPPPATVRVLWREAGLGVADKPAGLLANGEDSVETRLRTALDRPELRVVHRLDRDTTGCLLFAENRARFDAMVELFKEGRIGKTYHALAAGLMTGSNTIEKPVDNLHAVTRYRVLDAREEASHLLVRIETGRTHQIRKHLAMIRHPVLGDREYGRTRPGQPAFENLERQMLHAFRLEFPLPGTERAVRVESPLPADFRRALKQLALT